MPKGNTDPDELEEDTVGISPGAFTMDGASHSTEGAENPVTSMSSGQNNPERNILLVVNQNTTN